MTKTLSDAAVAQFHDQGYYSPVPVMSAAEAAEYRAELEAFEATQGGSLQPHQRNKCHLLFKWIDDLIHDPRVVDPMEDILGPDILCWNTLFWIKEAGSPSFVSWHQDITYWGLADGTVITAWLALSPATEDSGCMRVMPGTHIGDILPHEDRYDEANMLTRGQEIAVEVDEAKAVTMALRPGEMSMHNVRLAHASGPNTSGDRRIGLSMHFIPTSARQAVGTWDSAALVRGSDAHAHFHHTPRVARDFDPQALAFHEKATAALREVLYHGAERDTRKV